MRAQLIKRSEDYAVMTLSYTRNRWDEDTDSLVNDTIVEKARILDPHHHVVEEGAWYDVVTAPVFHKFRNENGKLCKEVMLFLIKATKEDANV